jgi:hypothetical protein
MAYDEPTSITYDVSYDNKLNTIFKSSGTVLTSGFTSRANDEQPAVPFGVDREFTLFTFDHLSLLISSKDVEGYFNFAGLTLQDRALNSISIGSSDFPNQIWIDPVAPVVVVSGITASGVTTSTPSSGIVVSGLVNLEFAVTETFNAITSGLVYYSGVIEGSGFTATFGTSSGLWNTLQQEETTSPSNTFDFDYEINTMDLYNGEYKITISALDFVGNPTEFVFTFVVANELEFTGISFNSGLDPLTTPLTEFSMVFNIPVTMSGISINSGLNNILRFEMNSTVANDNTSSFTQNNIVFVGIDPSNNKVLKFTLPVSPSFNIAKPYEVEVKILVEENFSDFNQTVVVNGNEPTIITQVAAE